MWLGVFVLLLVVNLSAATDPCDEWVLLSEYEGRLSLYDNCTVFSRPQQECDDVVDLLMTRPQNSTHVCINATDTANLLTQYTSILSIAPLPTLPPGQDYTVPPTQPNTGIVYSMDQTAAVIPSSSLILSGLQLMTTSGAIINGVDLSHCLYLPSYANDSIAWANCAAFVCTQQGNMPHDSPTVHETCCSSYSVSSQYCWYCPIWSEE